VKILVVDDERAIRFSLAELLESEGHKGARGGARAKQIKNNCGDAGGSRVQGLWGLDPNDVITQHSERNPTSTNPWVGSS
jgi:CheY-like chemotaxis protein